MDLKTWVSKKESVYANLVIIGGTDLFTNRYAQLGPYSYQRDLDKETAKFPPSSTTVFVCHDANSRDIDIVAQYELRHGTDVMYENPQRRPLALKLRHWLKMVNPNKQSKLLFIKPSNLVYGMEVDIAFAYNADVLMTIAWDPKQLAGDEFIDLYDDAFVMEHVGDEMQTIADRVGKRVWVDGNDKPRERDTFQRKGDAAINSIRAPCPHFTFDDNARIATMSTTLDTTQDATSVRRLWEVTNKANATLSPRPDLPRPSQPHQVRLLSRQWSNIPGRTSMTLTIRFDSCSSWDRLKREVRNRVNSPSENVGSTDSVTKWISGEEATIGGSANEPE